MHKSIHMNTCWIIGMGGAEIYIFWRYSLYALNIEIIFCIFFQIVIILRGIPGAGKSYVAKLIKVWKMFEKTICCDLVLFTLIFFLFA